MNSTNSVDAYAGVANPKDKTSHFAVKMFNKLKKIPGGTYLFSKILCFRSPYFGSIKPVFYRVEPGLLETGIKKHRAVTNHIGSVHALAMGNLCELSAGLAIETALPSHLRWIPKGMNIEYLKIAQTDLRAICQVDPYQQWESGDYKLNVSVFDVENQEVVRAKINMYLSERKS